VKTPQTSRGGRPARCWFGARDCCGATILDASGAPLVNLEIFELASECLFLRSSRQVASGTGAASHRDPLRASCRPALPGELSKTLLSPVRSIRTSLAPALLRAALHHSLFYGPASDIAKNPATHDLVRYCHYRRRVPSVTSPLEDEECRHLRGRPPSSIAHGPSNRHELATSACLRRRPHRRFSSKHPSGPSFPRAFFRFCAHAICVREPAL